LTHLEALGRQPRPAGSAAAATALDYCASHLTAAGFTIVRQPFSYSALPGRFGAPIVGVGAGALLIVAARLAQSGDTRWAMGALVLACVLVAGIARWIGGGGALALPVLRMTGLNLEATRGDHPAVWLVAHIDSKSQPVSTAVRTIAVLLLVVATAIGIVLSIAAMWTSHASAWNAVTVFAVFGTIPLTFAVVGSRSDGAADNASGLAAVLEAASLIPRSVSMGVLITDGEELALAGARAWVFGRSAATAINCDTIDDEGQFAIMRYGRSGLAERALAAARAEDARAILIRPLPGVLTDSVAFRDAGWSTVTLGRGNLRTLNRIHTVRDNLNNLRGAAIPAAARILARLVEELT
jgi:hypothetical protein